MKLYFTDRFALPLPEGHRFPMAKYTLLRERLERSLDPGHQFLVPPPATDREILAAHDASYLARVVEGRLSAEEIKRIGFPWSPQLVERSRRSAGATLAAARACLDEGFGVNLAGGTHHAFSDRGEGFCVFNDSAITAKVLLGEGVVERVMILDCDVHQGNGTAAILRGDTGAYTFSIHGRNNYPFRKEVSDLDIEVEDHAGDGRYLELLEDGLRRSFESFSPELVIYLAGADPHEGDKLGRLKMTFGGLEERDRSVLRWASDAGASVAVVMSGGYGANVEDTVTAHFKTVSVVAETATRQSPV